MNSDPCSTIANELPQYEGFWGTGFMAHFASQNERLRNGTLDNSTSTILDLDTLGITNGTSSPFPFQFIPQLTFLSLRLHRLPPNGPLLPLHRL